MFAWTAADRGLGRGCPPPGPNPQESPGNQRYLRRGLSSEGPANPAVFDPEGSRLKIVVSPVRIWVWPCGFCLLLGWFFGFLVLVAVQLLVVWRWRTRGASVCAWTCARRAPSSGGNGRAGAAGYRLDHLLISGPWQATSCRYLHPLRKAGLSDHSPAARRAPASRRVTSASFPTARSGQEPPIPTERTSAHTHVSNPTTRRRAGWLS